VQQDTQLIKEKAAESQDLNQDLPVEGEQEEQ